MNNKNITLYDEKIKHIFNVCKDQPMIIPIACACLLHGIKVIGMDVDATQLLKVESIFYGESTPQQRKWVIQERLKHNRGMIQKIQTTAKKDDKYIVLSGPMHVDIGTKLGIKKIDVISSESYFLLAQLFSQNENALFKEAMEKPEIQPDYAYIYNNETMKPLNLPLLTNESVEKARLVFRYALQDSSKTELEKGLTIAGFFNIMNQDQYQCFKDIKKFVTFGADVNVQDSQHKKTALHHAVEKKHVESIEELLKLNADIKILDVSGQTVLNIVQNNLAFFKTEKCNTIKEISMQKFPEEFKELTEKSPECKIM